MKSDYRDLDERKSSSFLVVLMIVSVLLVLAGLAVLAMIIFLYVKVAMTFGWLESLGPMIAYLG